MATRACPECTGRVSVLTSQCPTCDFEWPGNNEVKGSAPPPVQTSASVNHTATAAASAGAVMPTGTASIDTVTASAAPAPAASTSPAPAAATAVSRTDVSRAPVAPLGSMPLPRALSAFVPVAATTPQQPQSSPTGAVRAPAAAVAPAPQPSGNSSQIDLLCRKIFGMKEFHEVKATILALVQNGVSLNQRQSQKGMSPLIYAVFYCRYDVMRTLLEHGANPAYPDLKNRSPLEWAVRNMTDTATRLLLAYGAEASVLRPLLESDDGNLPISIRYWIERGLEMDRMPTETHERNKKMGLTRLRECFFSVVGQRMAARLMGQYITSHRLRPSKQPLVILLAGPSGHGKTALAQRTGEAIVGSDAFLKVDMSKITTQEGLFGSATGFVGSDDGSQLNNHLSRFAADKRPCAVLLDELEKTSREVLHGLLNAFDSGEWADRRHSGKSSFNVTNCIFFLTTNALDEYIFAYFAAKPHLIRSNQTDDLSECIEMLRDKLQETRPFSKAFAGRITEIIPYLPFSKTEAQVITDQLVRELAIDLFSPIQEDKHKFIGHVQLYFTNEAVRRLSKGYQQSTGARSLEQCVRSALARHIDDKFHWSSLPTRPASSPAHAAVEAGSQEQKSAEGAASRVWQTISASSSYGQRFGGQVQHEVWFDLIDEKVGNRLLLAPPIIARPVRPASPDLALGDNLRQSLQAIAAAKQADAAAHPEVTPPKEEADAAKDVEEYDDCDVPDIDGF